MLGIHFTSLPRAFLDRTFLGFEQQQQSLLPRELAGFSFDIEIAVLVQRQF